MAGMAAPMLGVWSTRRVPDGAWPPGGLLYRCHRRRYGATQFNPTAVPRMRFSPIYDVDQSPTPVWYAASSPEGATAESLLHDIPVRTGGQLLAAQFQGRLISAVEPVRPLRLIRLDTDGLRALRLAPDEVTETEADGYSRSAAIAQELHDSTEADGLAWVSRRRNIDCAIVLYADRVSDADLLATGTIQDFDTMPGWRWLREYTTRLGITTAAPGGA